MKKYFVLFIFFFFFSISVYAKDVQIFFITEGGSTKTNGFKIIDDYVNRTDGTYCATYSSNGTIKKLNSINGASFSISKSGTNLVSGREWYTYNYDNNKLYYFNQNNSYDVASILQKLSMTNDPYPVISLFAHWKGDGVDGGIDIGGSSNGSTNTAKIKSISLSGSSKITKGKATTLKVTLKPSNAKKETITWNSSNKNVATVNSSGKVTGVSKGTVTITAKTSSGKTATFKVSVVDEELHKVNLSFNMNGGKLASSHANTLSSSGSSIILVNNNSKIIQKITYDSKTSSAGLPNYNNSNYLNIEMSGYIAKKGAEWNTKPDGSGKSYNHNKVYKASDFCNAKNRDCNVTLYVNWVRNSSIKYVKLKFDMNGGSLSTTSSKRVSSSGSLVLIDKSNICQKFAYGSSTQKAGLINYNNKDLVNIKRNGFVAKKGAEWNTKKDGTGKSYNHNKVYKASDFCDASNKDCEITLYVNWVKSSNSSNSGLKTLSIPSSNNAYMSNLEVRKDYDSADPYALQVNGTYYIYSTGCNGIRLSKTNDFKTIRGLGSVNTNNKSRFTCYWAPEVYYYNNKYYMFYTGQNSKKGPKIMVSTSNNPEGPFTGDYDIKSLVNNPMDATVLFDGSHIYMYSMSQDNKNVYVEELNSSLTSVISSKPIKVLSFDKETNDKFDRKTYWDWSQNEGPFVIKTSGYYYMMYSAGTYKNHTYSIGYARSSSPTGTFNKKTLGMKSNSGTAALLHGNYSSWGSYNSNNKIYGPGHNSVIRDSNGTLYIVYHSIIFKDNKLFLRRLQIDRMGVKDGILYVNGPTEVRQPLPSGINGNYQLKTANYTVLVNGRDVSSLRDNINYNVENSSKYQNKKALVSAIKTPTNKIVLNINGGKKISDVWLASTDKEWNNVTVNATINDKYIVKNVKFGNTGLGKFQIPSISDTITNIEFSFSKKVNLTEVSVYYR